MGQKPEKNRGNKAREKINTYGLPAPGEFEESNPGEHEIVVASGAIFGKRKKKYPFQTNRSSSAVV